ncbi:MAG: rod shape-determining protein MreD [Alphaproteobacteria bacterium]|nr:rod shape-determining protein MreD [Alphaproteobacteria bacterium]
MADDRGSRLALRSRQATPSLIALVLILVSQLPLGITQVGLVMPPLALMAVFFWGIYRPDLLPLAAAFAIGLFQDLLTGGPPGLFAAVYVAVRAVMAQQRRSFVGRAFAIEWFGFGVVALTVTFASWAVTSAYFGRLLQPGLFLTQGLLSIALYPVLNWTMVRLRRAVSHI